MPFIEVVENGYIIDDSFWNEGTLIDKFKNLISTTGIDELSIACGVSPSPDFGYFELGDRFWRASLCIYFVGVTGGFIERGIGYSEPWLFNARHAIELYIKGQILSAFWFEELHNDHLSSGYINKVEGLKKKFSRPHGIYELYQEYQKRITDLIGNWNSDELRDPPNINALLLSQECQELLKELDESDKTSFRFRYPSFKKENVDHLYQLGWQHDKTELFPQTGLPKASGYFFDHIKVINSLHSIMKELKSIESYLGGCWDYIGEMQEWAMDMMSEFSDYTY